MKQQLVSFVSHFEGLSLRRYNDVAGYGTIGYGHLIKPGEDYSEISLEQAQDMLWQDLQKALAGVHEEIKVPLKEAQIIALTDFVFNLGIYCLHRSTIRMRLNRYDYSAAAEGLLLYDYAGGRKVAGLLRRRQAERRLFLS